MELDGSITHNDSDQMDLHDPLANDEYVKVDKDAHGSGEGSSSPEVISGPEGEEGEPPPVSTEGIAHIDVSSPEELEDDGEAGAVHPFKPPLVPISIVDPPPFETEPPPITPSEDPAEDFHPPDLPSTEPEMTAAAITGGVEDVVLERRPLKSFITSHTESFTSSSKVVQSDLPRATGYLSFLNALHPLVLQVIYWKDVKLSGASLIVALGILWSLCMNTMLHAVVLVLLASMVVSLVYIVTKVAIDSFYNREIQNPFLTYLEKDLSLPEERVLEITKYVLKNVNCCIKYLARLVFFDKIIDSLKFMLALFLVSYITNCLDVLTSLFLAVVLLFSVPPLYTQYQDQIDFQMKRYLTKLTDFYTQMSRKVPFLPKVKEE